jgi:hypothetical protein
LDIPGVEGRHVEDLHLILESRASGLVGEKTWIDVKCTIRQSVDVRNRQRRE